jgi:hypothetical protein
LNTTQRNYSGNLGRVKILVTLLDTARFDAITEDAPEETMNIHIGCMVITLLVVLATPLVNADTSPPTHSCRKPGKAAEVKTQDEVDKFNDAVDKYKSCIEDFVRQQQDAAMNHTRAANQAIGEWNEFVAKDMKQ